MAYHDKNATPPQKKDPQKTIITHEIKYVICLKIDFIIIHI